MQIPLTTGEKIKVDIATAARIHKEKWRMDSGGNVYLSYWDKEAKKSARLSLLKVIFGESAPKGFVYRHINGDRLDFRKANLELVKRGEHSFGLLTPEQKRTQNKRPEKRFVGVYTRGEKHLSYIRRDGKQVYLGTFQAEEDAARAYDAALIDMGFSPVNFPIAETGL